MLGVNSVTIHRSPNSARANGLVVKCGAWRLVQMLHDVCRGYICLQTTVELQLRMTVVCPPINLDNEVHAVNELAGQALPADIEIRSGSGVSTELGHR